MDWDIGFRFILEEGIFVSSEHAEREIGDSVLSSDEVKKACSFRFTSCIHVYPAALKHLYSYRLSLS
jgi:hypothetical protein